MVDFNNIGQIKITNAYTKKKAAQKEKEREKQEEEKKKQSAKEIRFAELNKNPDKHSGEFVKYQGEIVQIMENDDSTDNRLAVTKTSYGYDINQLYTLLMMKQHHLLMKIRLLYMGQYRVHIHTNQLQVIRRITSYWKRKS
ncbi:hypothetical protein [Bacillus swezeyi]|uniref:hypothetical protein n=1 Tax=Bacillus swezeyi TaxID=1925020 RepID=UPI00123A8269|nr:hypothetical protein [Bacillus swezeyi]KAA6473741.1 hypothetical protein DX928_20685 [Bacillus swezeyi]